MTEIFPTIHMNGTGAKMLIEDYERAYGAIRSAMEEFGRIEFNARDYYVQDDKAWENAREWRATMRDKMSEVEEYLLQHMMHISKSIK